MKNRVFRTTAITALLLSLTACSGYQGITAVHREMDARDNLPAAVQNSNGGAAGGGLSGTSDAAKGLRATAKLSR